MKRKFDNFKNNIFKVKIFNFKLHFKLLIIIASIFILLFSLFYLLSYSKNKTQTDMDRTDSINVFSNKNEIDILNFNLSENKSSTKKIPEIILTKFNTKIYDISKNKTFKQIDLYGNSSIKYVKDNGLYIKDGIIKYFKNNRITQEVTSKYVYVDNINNIQNIQFIGNAKIIDNENNFILTANKITFDLKNNIFEAFENVLFSKEETIKGNSEYAQYDQNQNKIILSENATLFYQDNYAKGKKIIILNFLSKDNNLSKDRNLSNNNTHSNKNNSSNNNNLLNSNNTGNPNTPVKLIVENGSLEYSHQKNFLFSKGNKIEFENSETEKIFKIYEGSINYISSENDFKTNYHSSGQFLHYTFKQSNVNKINSNKDNNPNKKNYLLNYIYKNAENHIIRTNINSSEILENVYFKSNTGKIIENKYIELKDKAIIIDYKNLSFIYGENLNYNFFTNYAYGKNNLVIFQLTSFENYKKLNLTYKKNNNDYKNTVINTLDKLKYFNYNIFIKDKANFIKKNNIFPIIDKLILSNIGEVNTETNYFKLEKDIEIIDFTNLLTLSCDNLTYSGKKEDYYILKKNIKIKKFEKKLDILNNTNLTQFLTGGKAKIYNNKKYGLITESPKLLDTKDNYYISSNIIEAYFDKNQYLFKNNVVFLYSSKENDKKLNTIAKSSLAIFDSKNNFLYLKGNSFISINGSESTAKDISIDIKKRKVYIHQIIKTKVLEF